MDGATSLNNFAEILSGPVAFLPSRVTSFFKSLSSLILWNLKTDCAGVIVLFKLVGVGDGMHLKCCAKLFAILTDLNRNLPPHFSTITGSNFFQPRTSLSSIQVDLGFCAMP